MGVGFLEPAAPFEYGEAYFQNYRELADGNIAQKLNAARVAMLLRHWAFRDAVIDVGIGAGTFIEAAPAAVNMHGYDVNPRGIRWLRARGLYADPYQLPFDIACFWDALEHIANPSALLANVRRVVLVSLPIFRDPSHVRESKHYKPGEHIWYFTDRGIRWFMDQHGFDCAEDSAMEVDCGREDIHSYSFVRR